MQHIAKKVKALMDGQAETLKSSRISTYNKLLRWMPFQTPIYFPALQAYFTEISRFVS